jgi:penicillin-binding protein 1C
MAAPLFFQIAEAIRGPGASTPLWHWPKGLNLKKEKVCRLSGHRPGKACHSLVESWVIPGKSFLPTCQLHRSIWISKKSGRRLCPGTEPEADAMLKDFEFWPSDVLKTYANLGVRLQAPPSYEDACRDQVLEESGSGPDIVSPQRGLVYSFSLLKPESWSVPFVAASAADARRISWFVGKSFVGQSEPSKAFVWKGTPGKHHVTAIDDLGRSRTIDLVVTVQR